MIREKILSEMKARKLSRYAVGKHLELTTPNSFYRFCRGEFPLSSDRVDEICDVLKLELMPTAKKRSKK